MKRQFTLSLLVLSFNALATDTFLSAIKSDFNPIKYSDLKEMVRTHAQDKGYLSLGESHLQTPTAIQVNHDLMSTYLGELDKRKTIFCTETLDHFLKPYAEEIKSNVKKYKVFEKNSRYVTDFKNCIDNERMHNYVTYSGFFHQYQFGKPFPAEFPRSPVVAKDGNNIMAQMGDLDGLFSTQMELEYMEFSASKAILEMGITDATVIRKKVAHLEKVVTALTSNMEEVIKTDDPYTSKKAVVINSKDFSVDLNGNDKSYFVMTNLSYRKNADSLKALRALIREDDATIEAFLTKLTKSKIRTVSVFLGPFPGGELGTVSYPGVTRTFKGQSLIMHIVNSSENYLMVMEPDATDFVCVDYKTSNEKACF